MKGVMSFSKINMRSFTGVLSVLMRQSIERLMITSWCLEKYYIRNLKNKNGNGGDNFGTHNSYILCEWCKEIAANVGQGVDKVEVFWRRQRRILLTGRLNLL